MTLDEFNKLGKIFNLRITFAGDIYFKNISLGYYYYCYPEDKSSYIMFRDYSKKYENYDETYNYIRKIIEKIKNEENKKKKQDIENDFKPV